MATLDYRLIESGFKSIGLCSSMWVDLDGCFRGGFFLFDNSLHLVLYLNNNQYYIARADENQVENYFQKGRSIYRLARLSYCPMWWNDGKFKSPTIWHRIMLWWHLRTYEFLPLPNCYYIWNEYIFSK